MENNKNRLTKINWIGAYTLFYKECKRFLKVYQQTILAPAFTSLLFFFVINTAIEGRTVNDYDYMDFLAPGLIIMTMMQNAFANTSSSLLSSKIAGNIVDLLYAPLSATEVTISVALASVTRSVMIAIVSIIVFKIIIDIEIKNYLLLTVFTLLSSFILGNIGIIAGLWAEKFDHMATVTNFIIVPLSFLSGTFYSIERLPDFLKTVSKANPFFYMIDGFRFSVIGQSDSSIMTGVIYLTILSLVIWFIAYILFKIGYKIKS